MKPKTQTAIAFILILFVSVIPAVRITAADSKQQLVIIPIEKELKAWKIKGPKLFSKWETGFAELNPKNQKRLRALPADGSSQALVNKSKGSLDIFTRQTFGDCTIELEVMVASKANSGIYVMGQYEVQVKDSFGKSWMLNAGDMGGVLETAKPMKNAARKPGEWQKYRIEFKAPRFKNGKRTAPAEFARITLNGVVIQENVRMEKGPTGGALRNGEFPKGPLMLQGGLGAVAYRNIRVFLPESGEN